MHRCLAVVWVFLCATGVAAAAEDLEFRAPAAADGAETATEMRSLAIRALPVYENPSREQFLTNLSALQMVAGEYAAANSTRQSLRELRRHDKTAREVDEELIYDLYAQARALTVRSRMPFDQAFARVFRQTVAPLDDLDAYTVAEWLSTPLSLFQVNLQHELDRLRGKSRISLSEAVDLAWTYLSFETFHSIGPLVGPLVAEDDRARYLIDDDAMLKAPGHAALSVRVVRPKRVTAPIPALLEFTAGSDPRNNAKESAANGYAGVVAYARRTGGSPDALAPYEHEGDEARAVIDWIAGQPWSNGRVGMYGSGYSAFAAWAAAKRPPPALKALAASSAEVPGIDAPSEDRRQGVTGAISRRWQKHPSFDGYWQKWVPYLKDFAHIDFPVLATTGYYDVDETGSLYYFASHYRYDPRADQTLLIGPYDSHAMQRGPLPVLAGYAVDESAILDLHELRYRWFDHVLKGAPSPDVLKDRVNFEVMGANTWRHVGSLEAMANGAVRLYLDATRVGNHFRLTGHQSVSGRYAEAPIDSSGTDSASPVITGVMTRALPPQGTVFVSGSLHRPLQVSGRISGQLVFAAGRGPLALALRVYELRPSGEYLQLFAPPERLASPAPHPGPARTGRSSREQRLDFRSDRLTSVELQTGSRIVLVLDAAAPAQAPKPSSTAHHGASRHADSAKASPPGVRWYEDSFIELPVWR